MGVDKQNRTVMTTTEKEFHNSIQNFIENLLIKFVACSIKIQVLLYVKQQKPNIPCKILLKNQVCIWLVSWVSYLSNFNADLPGSILSFYFINELVFKLFHPIQFLTAVVGQVPLFSHAI